MAFNRFCCPFLHKFYSALVLLKPTVYLYQQNNFQTNIRISYE